jgi:hypothetical protein
VSADVCVVDGLGSGLRRLSGRCCVGMGARGLLLGVVE